MKITVPSVMLALAVCVTAFPIETSLAAADPAKLPAPLFGKLGNRTHPITTTSRLAQRYFDQGLILCFGFNHKEAIRSFRAATEVDPQCPMAWWGIAYAFGPHINRPMPDDAVKEAWAAVQRAVELKAKGSAREQAYIDALAKRYSREPVADRAPFDRAYADAMRDVAQNHPEDSDAGTLWAEAMMNTMPWDYWEADRRAKPMTKELLAVLRGILRKDPDHPGANHLHIHAVEAGPTPEEALPSADRLGGLVPAAGHLVHMPSHIYVRVGYYHLASEANEDAIIADEDYIAHCKAMGFYPGVYYPHNLHFLWYSSTLEGRSQYALKAAKKVADYASSPVCGTTDILEAPRLRYLPLLVMARFGNWDGIAAVPAPNPKWPLDTAMWHYAQGLAQAAKGNTDKASEHQKHLAQVTESAEAKAMDGPQLPANLILSVANDVLAGKIAASSRDYPRAVESLQRAIATEGKIPYMEPAFWYYPVRLSLGATQMEAGDAKGAAETFRENLRRNPRDGWTLFGLQQSLLKLNQDEAAAKVERQFVEAWKRADIQPNLSWY